jgi:hypothetical protein
VQNRARMRWESSIKVIVNWEFCYNVVRDQISIFWEELMWLTAHYLLITDAGHHLTEYKTYSRCTTSGN